MANYFFLHFVLHFISSLFHSNETSRSSPLCATYDCHHKKSCFVKKDKARQYSSCPAWYTYNQAFTQSATGIQFPLFCFVFDVFTTVTAFICLLKATDDRILISQKSRSSSRIVRHCDCVWHMHISERASHRLVLLWISTGCPHRLEMLKHR